MSRNGNPVNIMLGKGVFFVDDIPLGYTRDGGKFSVEYEYRPIAADGDKGKVKGRIVKEGATPKMEINHLELLTSFEKLHPGIEIKKDDANKKVIMRGKLKIDDENDYHKIHFTGETKAGEEVTVTIDHCINLENLEMDLKDKDEVIDKITMTGVYEEGGEDEDEGWEISYGKGA